MPLAKIPRVNQNIEEENPPKNPPSGGDDGKRKDTHRAYGEPKPRAGCMQDTSRMMHHRHICTYMHGYTLTSGFHAVFSFSIRYACPHMPQFALFVMSGEGRHVRSYARTWVICVNPTESPCLRSDVDPPFSPSTRFPSYPTVRYGIRSAVKTRGKVWSPWRNDKRPTTALK